MAHNGIYATPNQVVANKNRKTKFEELSEEITTVNNSVFNLRNKLKNLLEEYSKDAEFEYHKDWEIIDVNVQSSWFVLEMKDYWGDPVIRQIPKDWLNNRNQYLTQLKEHRSQIYINNIKEDIKKHRNLINESTAKIENLKKELKDIETNKLLDSICTK